MKSKKNLKKIRVVAIILCVCLLFSGAATVLGAQGVDGTLWDGSYLRPIKANYLEEKAGEVSADSLEPNSKWREEPLKSKLKNTLKNDFSDTSECEQVWAFSAEEYEEAREWCLNNPKGKETNNAFLEEFQDNRLN